MRTSGGHQASGLPAKSARVIVVFRDGMAIVDELVVEAVQVLRACGCTVEPWSSNYPLWLVDGETFTDGGVMVLALRLNRVSPEKRLH